MTDGEEAEEVSMILSRCRWCKADVYDIRRLSAGVWHVQCATCGMSYVSSYLGWEHTPSETYYSDQTKPMTDIPNDRMAFAMTAQFDSDAHEKWYGYAGHLCVSRNCSFHLSTRVGGYLVSTVGHYCPPNSLNAMLARLDDGDNNDHMEPVCGVPAPDGKPSYFETMVFSCDGDTTDGDPNITDLGDIETTLYSNSHDAERGHYEVLNRYRQKAAGQR